MYNTNGDLMEDILTKLDKLFVNGLIIGTLSIFFNFILYFILKKIVKRFIDKSTLKRKEITIKGINGILLILLITLTTSQFTFTNNLTSTLLASGGIVAVIVGFASQEAASSVVSGLMIIVSKPFKIDDVIILKELELRGTVKEIKMTHTVIETLDKNLIMIPNTTMNKAIIENLTHSYENKIAYLNVEISYESDIDQAIHIMQEIIENHPLFYDTQDEVKVPIHCMDFKESGIALRAKISTRNIDDSFQICSDCRILIKKAFDEHQITIPYPHVEIIQKESCQ